MSIGLKEGAHKGVVGVFIRPKRTKRRNITDVEFLSRGGQKPETRVTETKVKQISR